MDSDVEALDWKLANEDAIANGMPQFRSNQHIIADLDDSERMTIVTDIGEEVITDDAGSSGTTLSPNARQVAFLKEFEKNFTIQLDMTHAHETGMSLGLELQFEVDYQPASVSRVRKTGLVEEWNLANPDKEVHVGDQIVQVNGIQWHHNTEDFVKRISGQFKSGRKLTPGANELLTLYVQRPRKAPHAGKRYPMQREDAHHKKYPVEFEATIQLPPGGVDMTASENDVMGWKLVAEHDWDPLSITNLKSGGVIGAYNKANPDHAILSGDELVKVNDVSWHHSADAFRMRVWQKFEVFRKQVPGAETMVLSIRRPAAVHEAALARAQGHPDSIQSSVAAEPPLETFGTTLNPTGGDEKPSGQRAAASLQEQIRAAAAKVEALNADKAEIVKKISGLVRKKMDIYSELAAAEEAQAELLAAAEEAERQDGVRRTLADLEAHSPAQPAEPAESPAGAPEGSDKSAPPEKDDDDGDVIGGYEDDDK